MGRLERDLVLEAFDSNWIAPLGPMVDAFEKAFCEYTGIGHAVALSSGTAAMHLALRYLGVEREDEVIASTLTFIGSVTPVVFQGAKPVFIDCDRVSWNMDPGLLAKELQTCAGRSRLPKAVVPTDLYGQSCDLDRIISICAPYDIPVVVDTAEALGTLYKGRHAGKGGRATIFSFNGNKIVTTAGGGMLASDDKALIDKARFWSQQARDSAPHYEHTEIGYNYRMSNILAAIGLGQLQVIDERVRRKRELFAYYQHALEDLPGMQFMPEADWGQANRWLTVITVDPQVFGANREEIRLALEAKNIEARPVWKPMHLQPVFYPSAQKDSSRNPKLNIHNYPCRIVGGGVAENLFEKGLCLPSGTEMANTDLDRIIEIIRKSQSKSKSDSKIG